MTVVPALIPASKPLVAPIVPTDTLLLLHEPPVVVLASVVAEPSQTVVAPVIAAGALPIATVMVA